MYESYFKLNEEPFGMTPNPRFLFLSRRHEEALTCLTYGVERRKGFIMITGEIGTGKTTLSRVLLKRFKDTDTALILNPSLTEGGLLAAIIEDFGLAAGRSIRERIDTLNSFLLSGREKGRNAVVIIDEAQNFSRKSLEMLRLLSNLETDYEKLLQIVLIGQPELRDKLKEYKLRQLNQRVAVRYHLKSLDLHETEKYIFHRLMIAGWTEEYLDFSKEAIKLVFNYSKGYPRLLNIICDRALMAAYSEEKRVVDKEMVRKAIADVDGYEA